MDPSSATQPADHQQSFAANFTAPLPQALRQAGQSASWDAFLAEYAPSAGLLRLGQWHCTDTARPAGRLGPQVRNYQATLALGDSISNVTAAASGPIAALTMMLHDCGIAMETKSFHQLPTGGQTATFLKGCDGIRTEWAMGLAEDPEESALRAVIACANRLLTDRSRAEA